MKATYVAAISCGYHGMSNWNQRPHSISMMAECAARRTSPHPAMIWVSDDTFHMDSDKPWDCSQMTPPMKPTTSTALLAVAILATTLVAAVLPATAQDALPSWNDGASKTAIVDFVGKITRQGGPDYVPPAERIATFDNDGTLWAEQPLYFQLAFALDRVKSLSPQHPEWTTTEPFASVLKGDIKGALAGGEPAIFQIATATHAGMTTEEFEEIVRDWIATARHPKTGRLYTEMVYQPMLELLGYLRANGFKTFIVSGGGIDFMRVFSERLYGIPPEQVIGSTGKLKFELKDGKPVLVKLPDVNFVDDKDGKPVGIQTHIGRRPIGAFGNSDGDLQMLQWTCDVPGPRLCLYVHHTDTEREWAYDRTSPIGKLDKGLDEAKAKGWTVVDMKKDWKIVFSFEKR
jgi:phosphoglycolate phosphatase-like HAD superfamily hydrolase